MGNLHGMHLVVCYMIALIGPSTQQKYPQTKTNRY
jgi:hypothetical protein